MCDFCARLELANAKPTGVGFHLTRNVSSGAEGGSFDRGALKGEGGVERNEVGEDSRFSTDGSQSAAPFMVRM